MKKNWKQIKLEKGFLSLFFKFNLKFVNSWKIY